MIRALRKGFKRGINLISKVALIIIMEINHKKMNKVKMS